MGRPQLQEELNLTKSIFHKVNGVDSLFDNHKEGILTMTLIFHYFKREIMRTTFLTQICPLEKIAEASLEKLLRMIISRIFNDVTKSPAV